MKIKVNDDLLKDCHEHYEQYENTNTNSNKDQQNNITQPASGDYQKELKDNIIYIESFNSSNSENREDTSK